MEQPSITPVRWPHIYSLDHDYVYAWIETGDQKAITVPAGFQSDGASIPRWAQSISGLTPDGLIRAAALIHDYLYVSKGDLLSQGLVFDRLQTDALFYKIMLEAGVPVMRAKIAYYAVRVAGWYSWEMK